MDFSTKKRRVEHSEVIDLCNDDDNTTTTSGTDDMVVVVHVASEDQAAATAQQNTAVPTCAQKEALDTMTSFSRTSNCSSSAALLSNNINNDNFSNFVEKDNRPADIAGARRNSINNHSKRDNPLKKTRSIKADKVAAEERWLAENQHRQTQLVKAVESEWPSFQMTSYNIWFGEPSQEERMEAIADILLRQVHQTDSPLWFIGLQEMTLDLQSYLVPYLESAGYTMVYQPMQRYYTALAIHRHCSIVSSGFVPYHVTAMGRGILYALVRLPQSSKEILIVTTHLESYLQPTYTGASQRCEQVAQVQIFCEEYLQRRSSTLQLAVVMGDLNWDDQRPRSSKPTDVLLTSLLNDQWQDTWLTSHPPNDHGYTYDSRQNAMLRGSLRRRLDRCLIRPRDGDQIVVVDETKLVGQNVIPFLIWEKKTERGPGQVMVSQREVVASDHFGLVVKLRMKL